MIVTEATLERIYRTGTTPRTITVACACGGTIRGDRFEPAAAVSAHNRSNRHRGWREARELMVEKSCGLPASAGSFRPRMIRP